MSKDVVYQCPGCGSPAIEYGELVGSISVCKACKWRGVREELLSTPFEHILGSREGIGFELLNDVRRLLSTPVFAVDIGGFLSRWGFINLQEEKSKVVRDTTRYLAAIARAILKATIEEREKIDKEQRSGTG